MSKNTDLAQAVSYSTITVTGSGNATVAASDNGKTFIMNLGTYGILTLPDPATLSFGWYINVLVNGSPATFQSAYFTHSGTLASKFIFKGVGYNTFILIGNGEGFRITLSPTNTYFVDCTKQPVMVSGARAYSGSGAWNSTATNWQTMPLNTFSGSTTCYNNGTNNIVIGGAGVYKAVARVQLWNNDSVTATVGRGFLFNGVLVQYDVETITTQQSGYRMMCNVFTCVPGDTIAYQYYTSNSTTWYYPDTDLIIVDLLRR